MTLLNVKELTDLEKALGQIDQALEKIKTTAATDFQQDIQAELKSPG